MNVQIEVKADEGISVELLTTKEQTVTAVKITMPYKQPTVCKTTSKDLNYEDFKRSILDDLIKDGSIALTVKNEV